MAPTPRADDAALEIADLLDELILDDGEVEVAYRDGRRYVNRLHRTTPDEFPLRQQNALQLDGSVLPYRLEIDKAGVLTDLRLNATTRRTPGPEEIEILVKAGGVNFRDVMKALGIYPGNPIDLKWFGDDVAGVVIAVGENVTSIRPGDRVGGLTAYSFRAYATLHQNLCFKLPDGISFEEAATLPTVFLTAHYAINHLARMRRGERILIHAGTGGVGQADSDRQPSRAGDLSPPQARRRSGRCCVNWAHHTFSSRTLTSPTRSCASPTGAGSMPSSIRWRAISSPRISRYWRPLAAIWRSAKSMSTRTAKLAWSRCANISVFVIDLDNTSRKTGLCGRASSPNSRRSSPRASIGRCPAPSSRSPTSSRRSATWLRGSMWAKWS
ncbi:MAG: alcohol dehydrogenase catalytic domain-containing protein [Caldilineaceae bacterium]